MVDGDRHLVSCCWRSDDSCNCLNETSVAVVEDDIDFEWVQMKMLQQFVVSEATDFFGEHDCRLV